MKNRLCLAFAAALVSICLSARGASPTLAGNNTFTGSNNFKGLLIYGDANHTNAVYVGPSGQVLSNANGKVTMAGGNITAKSGAITNQLFSGLYASQHTPVGVTNSASPTTVFSCTIPGGAIGSNGTVRVGLFLSSIATGNWKGQIKYGPTIVSEFYSASTSYQNLWPVQNIRQLGNYTNSIGTPASSDLSSMGSGSGNPLYRNTVDVGTDFVLSVVLNTTSVATGTNTLEAVDVEILGRN